MHYFYLSFSEGASAAQSGFLGPKREVPEPGFGPKLTWSVAQSSFLEPEREVPEPGFGPKCSLTRLHF